MTERKHEDPHKFKEREFETMADEFFKSLSMAWGSNVKRTYDEYQQESLETIKHMRLHFDKIISDAQQYDNQRQNIANQALQNAVETANMVGKQAVRHGDLSIDQQWNKEIDEGAGEAIIIEKTRAEE